MTATVLLTRALASPQRLVTSRHAPRLPSPCLSPIRRIPNLLPSSQKSLDARRPRLICSADSSPSVSGDVGSTFKAISEKFCSLFPVWLAAASVAGAMKPDLFLWLTTDYFTAGLAILMFSMGITLTVEDFQRVATKPGPVAINFLACYGVMPALGFIIGKALGLDYPFIAGLVLVGATNGGQASNLCTYIAKGDVALSVLMTTSTTIGCLLMTPLICKVVLGAVIPVDVVGIAVSTFQVVLAPIVLGVLLNKVAYDACRKVEPFCPIVGILSTIVLVGASIAKCADVIVSGGVSLQIPCVILHLVGGLLGYFLCKMFKYDEKISRTTAIETSMKSSAFSFLLATLHFGDPLVRVIPAISVVWMAIIGSSLAVFWRNIPLEEAT